MLKQLPVKKDYLMIAGAIVLLWLCYQLAFKKTIEAWQINTQLKTQLAEAADLSYQPGYLERKNSNLQNIIAGYKIDSVTFRTNTIATLSAMAEREGAKLTSVPTEELYFHTEHTITQKLEFEGTSFALIRLLQDLQNGDGVGYVRSAAFKVTTMRGRQDDARKLVLVVYLVALR